jgi:hypothetical protein
MIRHPLGTALAAAAFIISLAGAAIAQPPPYAPIPPPRFERIPPPPRGPRVIWEPGHWHWNGRSYVWYGGHYVTARPQYRHYEPGHWEDRRGRWVWIPAHWE